MASQINASNSGFGGIVSTGDSSGVLQLQTTGTTALTIDTSQNVGIGTTSPSYKLQASNTNGDTQVGVYDLASSGSSAARLDIRTSGTGASQWLIQTGNTASGLNGALRFYDQTITTERMRIDSSGNVFAGPTATQNGATGVIYSKTTAKAWVTFSGFTGTISSSFNVSSVTRVSTGIYTVNFTSAMPNANYSSFYMAQPTVSNAGADTFTINPTTTTVQCNHWEANTQRDSNYSCVVVFGSA